MVWTAKHTQCRPMCKKTRSFIINVTLLANYFICGPLSEVVFSIVFHDEGSVHTADVSTHAEYRIFHRALRRTEQFHKHCFYRFKSVSGDIHSLKRKGTCESLSLSLSFTQITCNNEHQCCQVITEWKKLFVVAHVCSIPSVSSRL